MFESSLVYEFSVLCFHRFTLLTVWIQGGKIQKKKKKKKKKKIETTKSSRATHRKSDATYECRVWPGGAYNRDHRTTRKATKSDEHRTNGKLLSICSSCIYNCIQIIGLGERGKK